MRFTEDCGAQGFFALSVFEYHGQGLTIVVNNRRDQLGLNLSEDQIEEFRLWLNERKEGWV